MATHTNIGQTIARAWVDSDFRLRLKNDPKGALAEMGCEFPDGLEIEVVENTPGKVYLTLPVAPWTEAVADDEIDPLIHAQGKSVCSKSNSCCCAHPDVIDEYGVAA